MYDCSVGLYRLRPRMGVVRGRLHGVEPKEKEEGEERTRSWLISQLANRRPPKALCRYFGGIRCNDNRV